MACKHVFFVLVLLSGFGLSSSAAFAQASRTWVSGVGNDANPCTRTYPCQTFAAAISKTAAGGEINCIDAGGFGVLMITKAISISCSAGEAGILASGTDGVIINAGPGDSVQLCGIDVEGMGTGLIGIDIIQAGQVRINQSTVRGFTGSGVNVAPTGGAGSIRVDVIDSVIADNAGSGIRNKPSGGWNVVMVVDRTTLSQNTGDGIMANGTNTAGSLNVNIRNSVAIHNGGSGFVAFSGGSVAQMMVDSSSASDNTNGLAANGTGATVSFTRSSVTGNATGALQVGAGLVLSYGTNMVNGNVKYGTYGTIQQQ